MSSTPIDTRPQASVIGESLVDIVADAAGRSTVHPGGSPLNVAVGLARLELDTTLVTRFGEDEYGALIRRHLEDSGVTVTPESSRAARTSSAQATLDAEGTASYTFDIVWDPELPAMTNPPAVHTGSIATFLSPGAEVVAEYLASLPEDTLVTFDPNARPSLAPSRETVLDSVVRIAARAHVVKMSDEDAAWLHPGESLPEVVARYLGAGPDLVVVTRGGDGCTVATQDRVTDLPSERVDVVDTIGAGDAFMSGLLYALLSSGQADEITAGTAEHANLVDCARTALRSAAVAVSRAGANPPRLRDLG